MLTNRHSRISTFLLVVLALSALPAESSPINVRIPSYFGVNPGDTLALSITMQSPMPLGGIDFTFHFDDSIFRPVSVQQDTGLKHWEWFINQYDSVDATVRVTAIADLPNGQHPNPSDFYPKGSIAIIRFLVSPSWTPDSSKIPFTFYWPTCADNAGSNMLGDSLLVIRRLLDSDGALLWDETDNYNFPENTRPPHIGVVDSCQQISAGLLYQLDFQNGSVANYALCGNVDGDQSLDISDAVYLISYIFASGPPPQPLLSGDVDCTGSVDISDVVLIITYIFGGGSPPCSCQ